MSMMNIISAVYSPVKTLMNEVQEFRSLKIEINKARCVIELDAYGNIQFANENLCKSLDYQQSELINQHHRTLLNRADSTSPEYSKFWENLGSGTTPSGAFKLVNKAGDYKWFQGYYAPVMDHQSGKLRKVVAYLTDITKDKNTTFELQGEEEALEKTFGIMECDMQAKILDCNDLFLGPLEFKVEEVVGKDVSMLLRPEVAQSAAYKQMWDRLRNGESIKHEVNRISKTGKEYWFSSTYVPLKNEQGKPVKVKVYSYCITEEKLKTADYRGQLEAINKIQGVIEFDLKGNVLAVNENFAKVTGYSKEEIVGKHHSMFALEKYKNSQEYKAFWDKLNRGEPDDGVYHRIGKGGKDIWLQASYNPIIGLDGKPFKVVKYATDITKAVMSDKEQRKKALEATMIKNALESSVSQLMVANNDGIITYMNPATVAFMREVSPNLKALFPSFDPDKLIGQNFDMFHKNPAHQRNLLASLTERHVIEMPVGDLFIRLTANPTYDDAGERLGSVIEWVNLTEEKRVESEIMHVVEAAANGDLSQRLNHLSVKGAVAKTMESINKLLDGMNEIILMVRDAGETINTASQEISTGNNDLSSRTEQQASSLEETASSMEELASTVKQNAENAKQANQLAAAASGVAIKGGEVVGQVVTTMSAINESSRKIEDIITVIDGIAFQTNILALNAAVEAARAGEQGRGFAVVAGEVRNLAQRSASAAKEIKELITDSVIKTAEGTKLVENAGTTMQEIVSSVQRVTDIMGEISAASSEQSSGIDQVNGAITNMDEVTQQNAALVEEAAAAAESLVEQAANLMDTVNGYKLTNNSKAWTERRVQHSPMRKMPADSKKTNHEYTKDIKVAKTGTDDSAWEQF